MDVDHRIEWGEKHTVAFHVLDILGGIATASVGLARRYRYLTSKIVNFLNVQYVPTFKHSVPPRTGVFSIVKYIFKTKIVIANSLMLIFFAQSPLVNSRQICRLQNGNNNVIFLKLYCFWYVIPQYKNKYLFLVSRNCRFW